MTAGALRARLPTPPREPRLRREKSKRRRSASSALRPRPAADLLDDHLGHGVGLGERRFAKRGYLFVYVPAHFAKVLLSFAVGLLGDTRGLNFGLLRLFEFFLHG